MNEQSFDAGRMAREQQNRMAASAGIGLNALRPIIQFQVTLLRLWADNIEVLAKKYENGLETCSSAIEHQRAAE
jgi:hypothetical protein